MISPSKYSCFKCGQLAKVKYERDPDMPESLWEVHIERVLCEGCKAKEAEKVRARQEEEDRRKLDESFSRSGLPVEWLNYDKKMGNLPLLNFIREHDDTSLFISEKTGTGKTRAVVYAAWQKLQENSIEIRFWRTTDMLRKISVFTTQSQMGEAERFINEMGQVDLLILDDLGKEKLTESRGEWLYDIIDKRYVKNVPVWITSNMGSTALINRMGYDRGEAMIRRLREMCFVWNSKKSG